MFFLSITLQSSISTSTRQLARIEYHIIAIATHLIEERGLGVPKFVIGGLVWNFCLSFVACLIFRQKTCKKRKKFIMKNGLIHLWWESDIFGRPWGGKGRIFSEIQTCMTIALSLFKFR